MKSHPMRLMALAIIGACLVAGCASTPQTPPAPVYTLTKVPPDRNSTGTIDSIQIVAAQSGGSSGVGAVAGGVIGGLLGNQIGAGGGRAVATVAGAVGGAMVGNNVEKSRNSIPQEYQVTVHLDNGQYTTVMEPDIYDFHVGSRVRVTDGHMFRE